MNVRESSLPGVLVIEPRIFTDERGYFLELWNAARYRDAGIPHAFIQDNLSFSTRGVLRGLHVQQPFPQGKLVFALSGEIFDVAVDVRVGSPAFGKWFGISLSATNCRQLYIPPGLAHGFCVLSDSAHVAYKCTDRYSPQAEHAIRWDDPDIGIEWPVSVPILSPKDQSAGLLRDLDPTRLPRFDVPGRS
jgi:dTDP-4-dehydrorhamnose 3,5-epimerase